MSDMLADMLRKIVPPEVMAMLTPERIKEVGEQATAVVTLLKESLARIEEQNGRIEAKLDRIFPETTLEPRSFADTIKEILDGHGNSGRRRAKPGDSNGSAD